LHFRDGLKGYRATTIVSPHSLEPTHTHLKHK
jgi:hypothetical protein